MEQTETTTEQTQPQGAPLQAEAELAAALERIKALEERLAPLPEVGAGGGPRLVSVNAAGLTPFQKIRLGLPNPPTPLPS